MPLPPSLRIIFRNKTYSILNIVGLSIGLSIALLICLMVYNEQSFDKSFKESKNIYRINSYLTSWMPGETFAQTSNQTGPYLQEAVPEIITSVRTFPQSYVTRIHDNQMKIRMRWADEDFFRLFNTPFIQGTPEDVMKQPNAIAISESMAKKLFGKENPMGQSFSLDNKFPVEVKAVYKDYPKNSSFYDYQVIAPFKHGYPEWFRNDIHWGNFNFATFALFSKNVDINAVGQQIAEAVKKGMGNDAFFIPKLQPLQDLHLYSGKIYNSDLSFPSDMGKVKTLTVLAIAILLIACVNYMNLSTARAQKRSKEIGVRKTLGAKRSGLILRLTAETGIITSISFVLAFILAGLLLPIFNAMLNQQLSFSLACTPVFLLGALLIWLATTLLSAFYPAIHLSSFPPLLAIRSASVSRGSGHAFVRKILTVGQFVVAIVLIAWVLVIQGQIRYVNNKDLGFNPHNLVAIPAPANVSETLANEYRSLSSVEMVARESGKFFGWSSGNTLLKNPDDKTGLALWNLAADNNFIHTMQLKLIAGKTLPENVPEGGIVQIILNRKAVEYLETTPEEIIGKEVLAQIGAEKVIVCGVVENFNFVDLYQSIEGFGIHNWSSCPLSMIVLRLKNDNITRQLNTFEQIFKKYAPNEFFDPGFSDQMWADTYEAEHRTNRIAISFSILAIFVACMGVFGLTAFMTEQRTKEIGIRKVMGASIYDIVSLFTNSYLRLLFISLIIALPVAWWLGNNYLNDFAFRISVSWWMFTVAALITIIITILTVCTQAVKAAMGNPVGAMRGE